MKGKINRKLIFTAAWIIIYLDSVNATFSILSVNLEKLRGWTIADITWAYPIYLLVFSLVGILAGKIADNRGASQLIYAGSIIYGTGWLLTGTVTTIPMLYLVFGIIAGFGGGLMYNSVVTTTLKWFPESRGKVSGLLLSAAAISPFIMAPVLSKCYEAFGVTSTLRYFGIIAIIVPFLLARTQIKPQDDVLLGKGSKISSNDKNNDIVNLSPKQMLSSSIFYKMIFIFIAVAAAGNMMIGVLAKIATVQIKLVGTAAALAVSVSTISNFIGRLSFGVIYDKLGGVKSLIISLLITVTALLSISFTGNSSSMVFYTSVAVLGFAFGGPLVIFPPLTSKVFGPKYLGTNYGIMFLGYSLAAFVGPRIATYFFSRTGVFKFAYFTAAVLAVMGILVVITMGRDLKKNKFY